MVRERMGVTLALLILLSGGPTSAQAKKEQDRVTWKLPHDRAAVYDVFDLSTRKNIHQFWLIGCDLDRRIGATDARDLPLRYLFRRPKTVLQRGAKWEVAEWAFADPHGGGQNVDNVKPLQIVGFYIVERVVIKKPSEIFQVAHRNSDIGSQTLELAILRGQFAIYRAKIDALVVKRAEGRPSATLTTLSAIRTSDGAIIGARYDWNGRLERYETLNAPTTSKVREGLELGLREPLVEITKANLRERINEALDKGARWLKRRQSTDGRITDPSYPAWTENGAGVTALAALALLHSGISVKDAVVQRAFAHLTKRRLKQSYDLGPYLMALEGKYLPLRTYEDAQNYSEDRTRNHIASKITQADKEAASQAARRLIENQAKSGGFGYGAAHEYPNLSSTQYAILGLKSASRMGISIPPSVWKAALKYLEICAVPGNPVSLKVRMRGGSVVERTTPELAWRYIPSTYPYTGQMNTAALAIMAICKDELVRAKELSDAENQKLDTWAMGTIAWLQQHYSIRSAPPEGIWKWASMPYLYLYSLERAAVFVGLEELGDHSWYLEGASALLAAQLSDGSWKSPHKTAVLDTALAMLFLKRATVPIETPIGPSVATVDSKPKEK